MLKEIKLKTFLTMLGAYTGKVCMWVGEYFVFVNLLSFSDSQSKKCLFGVTSLKDVFWNRTNYVLSNFMQEV